MSSVILRGLTKRYGKDTALDGVSLHIEHGQMVCLLGPSGCGKTTALRLVAGFIPPDDGEILLGDKLVSSPGRTLPPEQRNVSMVFQSHALWPHMTVAENVAYGLAVRKLDRASIGRKVSEMLATTRLAPFADRYPAELSGGQQQRVSLARALVVEPDTLLLDEPLSSLDANLREEMRFEVRRLHDACRTTSIYVTHDQGEAMTTADRIAVMNAGRIEQVGTPEEVYDRPRSEFVARFLGGSNILRGTAIDATHLSFAGTPIECSGATLAAGAQVSVCIRQHDIGISNHAARPAANAVQCKVVRNVFLGGARDYLVEAPDGTQLRITASPGESFEPGASVWLTLPPDRCRALEIRGHPTQFSVPTSAIRDDSPP